MQVVQLLVGSDGVHVGVDAMARLNIVLSQRQSFPLSQRVYYLCFSVTQILDGKTNRPLHPIEVVVDAQSLENEQGGGDATQAQFGGKVLLKKVFYLLDAPLCLLHVQ